jgi:hypothetical protein
MSVWANILARGYPEIYNVLNAIAFKMRRYLHEGGNLVGLSMSVLLYR